MTNHYRILLAFLCLLVLSPIHAQDSDSTVVFNREHPLVYEDAWDLWPYTFLNENGEPDGYHSGYTSVQVGTRTVNVPEESHYETKIVKEAWTEKKLIREAGWY